MGAREVRLKRAQYLFGTVCSIELTGIIPVRVEEALEAAFRELDRVSRLMNPFDPDSELSRLNAFAGRRPHPVSQELLGLIEATLRMAERTDGRYDPTMWPLLELWQQCQRDQRWPTDAEREAAVEAVGWQRVGLDHANFTLTYTDPRMKLDLSSLAKGYAVDCALAVARQFPISAARLDVGGELLVWSCAGETIETGMADPQARAELVGVLRLANQAVATSNQSEPHLVIGAQAVGHLFDMKSGLPLETDFESVTVIAPSAMTADLLSTAAFLVGPADWPRLAAQIPGASAGFLRRDGWERTWATTEGFPLIEDLITRLGAG